MGVFRFVFLPEFARPLRDAGHAARRTAALLSALVPPPGPPRPGNLLLPAARPRAAAGLATMAAGAALAAYGIAGFEEAAAQTLDPALFAEEDRGTRKLLGFLGDIGTGSASPVLGRMLFVFNAGVMLLAGFLLVWHTVAGTVDTAREGRWGFGGWEILRIVAAVALMAPMPGGMSGAQHVVIGLARLGGDFANAVWEPFSVETLGKGRAVVPWPREGAWRTVIARTLVAETCMYVANAEARAAGDAPYVVVRTAREVRVGSDWVETDPQMPAQKKRRLRRKLNRQAGTAAAEALHYDGNGRGMPRDICGMVRFVGLDDGGGRGIAARGHRDAWLAARPAIADAARELGDLFLAGTPTSGDPLPGVGGVLDAYGVAGTYRAIVELRVKEAGDAEREALREAVLRDAREISWLAAASFVNTLAASAAQIQLAAHNVPRAGLASPDELARWSRRAEGAVRALIRGLARDSGYEAIPLASATGIAGGLARSVGRGGSLLDRIMNFIDVEAVLVADSGNPLLDLASTGFALMYSAIAAMGAFAGVSVGSNFAEAIPVVGKGLDVFEAGWQVMDGLVTPAIGILIVAGAVLAYVLPAIPFIRFLFGILAWLLAVIEALLAVTVFCAAHVTRGEGDRLAVSATRHGWLFLPGLILRPALMLFGLAIGYFAFATMIEIFNAVWIPRMVDANAASGLGPVDFIAMIAIYITVAYGLLNASFKLIDILPTAVLAWIGGQGGGDAGGEGVASLAAAGMGRAGALRPTGRLGPRPGMGRAPGAGAPD